MTYKDQLNTVELIAGIKNKDQEALISLYNCYAPTLMGIVVRQVKNQKASGEILQDVFIKIWKNMDDYDATRSSLFTWMLTITHQACKEHFGVSLHDYEKLFTQAELGNIKSKLSQTVNEDRELHQKVISLANIDSSEMELKNVYY